MERQPGADDFPDAFERALDQDKGVALPVSDRLAPVTTRARSVHLHFVVTSVEAYSDESTRTAA
jgi:hypothetical protein